MKTRILLSLGTVLLLSGLVSLATILLPQLLATTPTFDASVNAKARPVVAEEPVVTGKPVHITFSRVDVSVAVAAGHYDQKTNTWTLANDKAFFADNAELPNNKSGNTFVYGHNRWQVFTKLLQAEPGDTATIVTDNGHTFTYTLRDIVDTTPDDISYLSRESEKPILTVQTCVGVNYEKRRMLTYVLTEVK